MTIFCIQRWSLFKILFSGNVTPSSCYYLFLMKPLHYEGAPTASHAIFYLFKMEKNILISN